MPPITVTARNKLLFGFAIAVAYGLLCVLVSSRSVMHDAAEYFQYGQNWAATFVYGSRAPGVADMNREPAYGVFLGLCLKAFGFLFGTPAGKIGLLVFCQGALYAACAYAFAAAAPLPFTARFLCLVFQLTSGAMLGANTEIYSETIAVSALTLLLLSILNYARRPVPAWLAFGSACFAVGVLAKAYLFYFVPFLLLGGFFLFRRRRAWGVGLIAVAFAGVAAQKAWDARNTALFGDNLESGRMAAALSGKILRAEEMEPARDWNIGLSASIGNNFCEKLYGRDPCFNYSIWRQDAFGFPFWGEYVKRFAPNQSAALAQLKRDMARRWFEHPGKQLYSSFLEAVRIVFFEAPPQRLAAFWIPGVLLQLWHVLGSLFFWALAALGARQGLREGAPAPVRAAVLFSLGFVLVHFAFMSQVGNMTRYALPFTPFVYFCAALGASRILPGGRATS